MGEPRIKLSLAKGVSVWVRRDLDVELPRIEECLLLMPVLFHAQEQGIHVRITLPLERDPGFPERAWDLEPCLTEGVEVRWGPTVRESRVIVDGRNTYRLEGESLVPDAALGEYPLASVDGTVQIFSGEVLGRQGRDAGLSRLDRLLFVRIWALRGRFPLYFSSTRAPVDALLPGDRIKVLFVIVWGGSGLFSAFAPSELYYEGVSFRRTGPENALP